MTRRMWRWVGALALLAAVDLTLTIHGRSGWQAPPDTQATMTLGQLLGFVTSAGLIIVLGLVLAAGIRSARAQRRRRRLVTLAAELGDTGQPTVIASNRSRRNAADTTGG